VEDIEANEKRVVIASVAKVNRLASTIHHRTSRLGSQRCPPPENGSGNLESLTALIYSKSEHDRLYSFSFAVAPLCVSDEHAIILR
jgi:hypothetical protein